MCAAGVAARLHRISDRRVGADFFAERGIVGVCGAVEVAGCGVGRNNIQREVGQHVHGVRVRCRDSVGGKHRRNKRVNARILWAKKDFLGSGSGEKTAGA